MMKASSRTIASTRGFAFGNADVDAE